MEKVVDWSPEPLGDLSEAREDDEKAEEEGEVVEASTIALKGDVEEVVDWSQEPLGELSEAREEAADDEKDEEVEEVV